MNEPAIHITCVSNIYIKMMHFLNVNDSDNGHSHPFNHVTLLASGELMVKVDGIESKFVAPTPIFIKADKIHKLVSLLPNTIVFCIHALRDGDDVGDILDPTTIPIGINALELAKDVVNIKTHK